MTGGAVSSDTESLFAVMAKTTRLTIRHFSHDERWILLGDNVKNIIVTSRTVFTDRFHLHMCIVAELNLAYRVSLQVDFVLDPTTVKNGWQSHHKQDCKYHPTPCHNIPPSASLGNIILILTIRPTFLM
jgi:hypothetical protein